MDQTVEEKKQKKILELKKALEKEIEEKKQLLSEIVAENEGLEKEEYMLMHWLERY